MVNEHKKGTISSLGILKLATMQLTLLYPAQTGALRDSSLK